MDQEVETVAVTEEAARRKFYDWISRNIGDEEAESIMTAIPRTRWEDLVTKDHMDARLADLRTELNSEVSGLRTELKDDISELRAELKDGISGLRTELASDISGLRTGTKDETASLRSEMYAGFARVDAALRAQLYWTVGAILTVLAVLVPLVVALH